MKKGNKGNEPPSRNSNFSIQQQNQQQQQQQKQQQQQQSWRERVCVKRILKKASCCSVLNCSYEIERGARVREKVFLLYIFSKVQWISGKGRIEHPADGEK